MEDKSKRLYTKKLIASLAQENPMIEGNIYKSSTHVNLSTIISYKDKNGEIHSFDDDF